MTSSTTAASPVLLDEEELGAWRGLLRAHSTLTKALDAELEDAFGLPLTSYEVLITLQAAPSRRLRMAELADRVMLSRPGLTGVVNRLEGAGLVRREASAADGRGLYAVITDPGLDCLHAAHRTHVASIREHFASRFDEAELRTLHQLLARLT